MNGARSVSVIREALRRWLCGLTVALVATSSMAEAEVIRVDLRQRETILDGKPFGEVGAYEILAGQIHFAWDPGDPANAHIVDLDLAPCDTDGRVRASAIFFVLQPEDLSKGSGTALIEVSNRGGKAALAYFNRARGSRSPQSAAHFGDGFLMRRGLSVMWVGWQFDVPATANAMRLNAPHVTGADAPTGWVRADWVVEQASDRLAAGHRNHDTYPPLNPDSAEHRLSVREGRDAERVEIPRDAWRFVAFEAEWPMAKEVLIECDGGFEAGKIYELVYRAAEPAVVGLGLAAIRDFAAFIKRGEHCPFPVDHAIALGISQTGRFLRHFLYQGFNRAEDGREALDGVLIHTAGGGRGSFNHRFAQPSRDAHRYSAFFYPTDLFPFSGRVQRDPLTGRRDGLLASTSVEHHPKIFYTNTGYEYWGRAASLLHTSLDGSADVAPLADERIYHLASAQHFTDRFPPGEGNKLPGQPAYRGNPLDFLVTEKALLAALQDWVERGVEPPPSAYPRIDEGSLVQPSELNFPSIPGVSTPQLIHVAYRADYGPRFASEGVVDLQPPRLGLAFPSLVSQLDGNGNELAGVHSVEIDAPLATYYPWSLRAGMAGEQHELRDFRGTFVPLPWTEEERNQTADPRPSVESLYTDRATYLKAARTAANALIEQRFLLREDLSRVMTRAAAHWDWRARDH